MKTLLTLFTMLTLAGGDAWGMASRNPNAKLTPDQLANLPEDANYVSGGESVDRAVSPEVLQSIAAIPTADGQAVYGRYTTFGEDVAPDAPVADTQAIEGKNALDQAMKAFGASKSPQAAAALAALAEASKIAQNLTKPPPQGDRKGGAQLSFMKGDSADVATVARTDAEQLTIMRTKQVPRANAATTTTRTEKSEWTEGALEIAGKYADRITSNYWAFTLASQAEDEKEVVEGPDDPQTPAPVPVDDQGNVAPADRNGTQAFLWKPVSYSNGKLVVLLPAKFNGLIDSPATINGERGTYTSTANGNRAHFRFSKPGSAYGSNVEVTWGAGGKTFRVVVPNGGQRFQTDDVANPAVPTPVSQMPGQTPEAPPAGE